MTESSEIQQLREEIQNLRYLYKKLAETMLPEDEATPEEATALDWSPKEYISEGELIETLRELPTSKEVGFLAHRPDSIPSPPRAEPHVWQEGYGDLDLLKLNRFGMLHTYRSNAISMGFKRFPIHPTTKVVGFLGTLRKKVRKSPLRSASD